MWILLTVFGMICAVVQVAYGQEVLYNDHGRRDPFTPLVSFTSKAASGLLGVERIEDLIVEGIVYDPKKGSVVIANNTVLKEGEELGNVRVVQIKPSGALFSVNGVEGFKSIYQQEET